MAPQHRGGERRVAGGFNPSGSLGWLAVSEVVGEAGGIVLGVETNSTPFLDV